MQWSYHSLPLTHRYMIYIYIYIKRLLVYHSRGDLWSVFIWDVADDSLFDVIIHMCESIKYMDANIDSNSAMFWNMCVGIMNSCCKNLKKTSYLFYVIIIFKILKLGLSLSLFCHILWNFWKGWFISFTLIILNLSKKLKIKIMCTNAAFWKWKPWPDMILIDILISPFFNPLDKYIIKSILKWCEALVSCLSNLFCP